VTGNAEGTGTSSHLAVGSRLVGRKLRLFGRIKLETRGVPVFANQEQRWINRVFNSEVSTAYKSRPHRCSWKTRKMLFICLKRLVGP